MTNAIRGETEVQLGDTTYLMRPTFNALAAIENDTDSTMLTLGQRLSLGSVRATDIVTVLFHGIAAGGDGLKGPTKDEIGDHLMRDGFPSVTASLIKFMESILSFYIGPSNDDAPDPPKSQETAPD